jgi:hypothetical protein
MLKAPLARSSILWASLRLKSQIGAPVSRMLGFRSGSCLHTKHNTETISEAAVSAHKTQY